MSGRNRRTYRSGWVDISPDTLEHLAEFGLGGLYRLGTRSVESADALLDGRQLEDRNVPFLRKVSGEIMPYEDTGLFYDRREEIETLTAEVKTLPNYHDG